MKARITVHHACGHSRRIYVEKNNVEQLRGLKAREFCPDCCSSNETSIAAFEQTIEERDPIDDGLDLLEELTGKPMPMSDVDFARASGEENEPQASEPEDVSELTIIRKDEREAGRVVLNVNGKDVFQRDYIKELFNNGNKFYGIDPGDRGGIARLLGIRFQQVYNCTKTA